MNIYIQGTCNNTDIGYNMVIFLDSLYCIQSKQEKGKNFYPLENSLKNVKKLKKGLRFVPK